MATFRFHPHGEGINRSVDPILRLNGVAHFVTEVQKEAREAGCKNRRITRNDITFHRCKIDKDCSDAFMAFAKHVRWKAIYAVCVELPGEHIPIGYSDRSF